MSMVVGMYVVYVVSHDASMEATGGPVAFVALQKLRYWAKVPLIAARSPPRVVIQASHPLR